MKKLIDNEVDVAIGGTSLQYVRTLFLSESHPYTSTPLVVMMSSGEEYGDFEKFARPFSIKVWLAIWIVFAICAVITVFAINSSKNVYDFVIDSDIKAPFLNIFAVKFGIPQSKLPKRTFARYTLIVFTIYCLVLRSVYQGGIFNSLKSHDRKPDVTSIDEMIEQKFLFYIYETLAPRVKDFKFFQRSEIFPNAEIDIYRRKTLNPSTKVALLNYLDQVLYVNMVNYKNFTYHVCKERFSTNQFVFYFRKNHFMVDEINEKIDLMLMGGIIDQIISRFADIRFLNEKIESKQPSKLTIQHFMGAFRILWMCNAIGIAVFIVEIFTKIKKLRMFEQNKDFIEHRM